MTVQYMQLPYEEYKELERQMREFKETSHKSEAGFYHKSIRLRINPNFIIEFHGPLVLAGQAILEPEQPHASLHPAGDKHAVHATPSLDTLETLCKDLPSGHPWEHDPRGVGWLCTRCGARKTGGT